MPVPPETAGQGQVLRTDTGLVPAVTACLQPPEHRGPLLVGGTPISDAVLLLLREHA